MQCKRTKERFAFRISLENIFNLYASDASIEQKAILVCKPDRYTKKKGYIPIIIIYVSDDEIANIILSIETVSICSR